MRILATVGSGQPIFWVGGGNCPTSRTIGLKYGRSTSPPFSVWLHDCTHTGSRAVVAPRNRRIDRVCTASNELM